jgi:hypothetical protein
MIINPEYPPANAQVIFNRALEALNTNRKARKVEPRSSQSFQEMPNITEPLSDGVYKERFFFARLKRNMVFPI